MVTAPHVAVASGRLIVVLFGRQPRCAQPKTKKVRPGGARCNRRRGARRHAKLQVGCSGSRVRLPLRPFSRFGGVNSRSVVFAVPRARSGVLPGWRRQVIGHPRRDPATRPNHLAQVDPQRQATLAQTEVRSTFSQSGPRRPAAAGPLARTLGRTKRRVRKVCGSSVHGANSRMHRVRQGRAGAAMGGTSAKGRLRLATTRSDFG